MRLSSSPSRLPLSITSLKYIKKKKRRKISFFFVVRFMARPFSDYLLRLRSLRQNAAGDWICHGADWSCRWHKLCVTSLDDLMLYYTIIHHVRAVYSIFDFVCLSGLSCSVVFRVYTLLIFYFNKWKPFFFLLVGSRYASALSQHQQQHLTASQSRSE